MVLSSCLPNSTYNPTKFPETYKGPAMELLPTIYLGGGKKSIKLKSKLKKKYKWSAKYKKSINCKKPKGFSQKQHCKYGRKKMTIRKRKHNSSKLRKTN